MNFISLIFQRSRRSVALTKLEDNVKANTIKNLFKSIERLDQEIKFTSNALLEAQIVRIRSIFSRDNNILSNLQRRVVESTASSSVQWYQQELSILYKKRRGLQLELDRITGKRGIRRLQNYFKKGVAISLLLLAISFVIMGIFATLYLLPIFLMIALVLILIQRINLK